MTDESTKPSRAGLRLRVPQLVYEATQWPNKFDVLKRNVEIENLAPVLLGAQAPLVLAVDAPWGGGKTTFFKLFELHLKQSGYVSLYMNAWESDFAEDPLLPMLSVMDCWLDSQSELPAVRAAWKKAKSFAPGIIKSSAVAIAKAATLGALDLDKEMEKIAADVSSGIVGDLVDSFRAKERSLELFKKNLSASLEALPNHQENLIIFIDELDRCRPTYAVEVLERVKHLFDIEKIVFVLGINRHQLGKSVQGVYGASFDGYNYLRRFIDMDYQLAEPDLDTYARSRLHHGDFVEQFSDRREGNAELSYAAQVITFLAERFSYSLRDIDQVVMRFKLILKGVGSQQYLDVDILLCMLVIRDQKPELYRAYTRGLAGVDVLIEFLLGFPAGSAKPSDTAAYIVCSFINAERAIRKGGDVSDLLDPWRQSIINSGDQELVDMCSYIVSVCSDRQSSSRRSNLRKLAFDRIELVAKLTIT